MGLIFAFDNPLLIILSAIGFVLLVKYFSLRKAWNILTIDGRKVHYAIDNTNGAIIPGTINAIIKDNEEESATENSEIDTNLISENNNSTSVDTKKNITEKFGLIALITSILSVLLFITVIFWFPLCVVSLIFSILVLVKGYKGKKLAIVSIVIDTLCTLVMIIILMSW